MIPLSSWRLRPGGRQEAGAAQTQDQTQPKLHNNVFSSQHRSLAPSWTDTNPSPVKNVQTRQGAFCLTPGCLFTFYMHFCSISKIVSLLLYSHLSLSHCPNFHVTFMHIFSILWSSSIQPHCFLWMSSIFSLYVYIRNSVDMIMLYLLDDNIGLKVTANRIFQDFLVLFIL